MNALQYYRFTVEGQISESVSVWFSDMHISVDTDTTVICGALVDQAALHGIIARIRDLGLTLIKIERNET